MSTTDPLADDSLADRLRVLHEHYVDAVNRAVAADRYDLVAELVADYPEEALALMAPCPTSPNGRPSGIGIGRRRLQHLARVWWGLSRGR